VDALTRRNFLRTSLTAAAVGTVSGLVLPSQAFAATATRPQRALRAATTTRSAGLTTAPYVPYSASSFFRSTVVGAPQVAARTTAFHSFMASFAAQKSTTFPLIQGVGSNKWGTAFAIGTASDPIWKLTGAINSTVAVLATKGFHAPNNLAQKIQATSDAPFCVLDVGSGFTVFGTKVVANLANHTINIGGSAAILYHSSNGLDKRNPKSDDARNLTSRGRISDALVIRRDLVDHALTTGGDLGHVLHLFMVETNSSDGFCSPMVGCEGSRSGFGAEGERIAINPAVNLVARGLTGAALVVAKTLQSHGAYIGDNAGGASTIKAEQTSSAGNPWSGTNLTQNCLSGKISWSDFVVITKGWQ
jgi:hypothetical protein